MVNALAGGTPEERRHKQEFKQRQMQIRRERYEEGVLKGETKQSYQRGFQSAARPKGFAGKLALGIESLSVGVNTANQIFGQELLVQHTPRNPTRAPSKKKKHRRKRKSNKPTGMFLF
jgi:hypothetical protein